MTGMRASTIGQVRSLRGFWASGAWKAGARRGC